MNILRSNTTLPGLALSLALSFVLAPSVSNAGQHALLVGVSDYTDSRIPDLEGPVHDVRALREVLIRNWQFDDTDITVLLNAQATEAAILNAIDNLRDKTLPGDDIIIYYSGHGTSAADPELGARLNLPDGSGAIVGSDFSPEKLSQNTFSTPSADGLLVGRFEIRPRLQALDKDRNVLVIFDACFSGNATREVASAYKPARKRQLDLSAYFRTPKTTALPATMNRQASTQKTRSITLSDFEKFSYDNTVYFGAAAENQFAVDLSMAEIKAGLVSTVDGMPHGGFTDSLLRALSTVPGTANSLSFIQLFNRTVNMFNTWCKTCGHTPVSLPTAGTPDNELLGRTILMPSLLLASNSHSDNAPEPAFQETLLVDTVLPNGTELAMRSLTSRGIKRMKAVTETISPDLYFTRTESQLSAYSADGQLITHLPVDMPEESMSRWLEGREWLKRRMMRDLKKERGDLQVSFREPLASNRVSDGEFIHFNVLSDTEANLVVLLLDANSELSLLYPASDSERRNVLPALKSQRIPRIDEQAIQVTPPWGTDIVMFYTLPANHSLTPTLTQLASLATIPVNHPTLKDFEKTLDDPSIQYSAMTIRIVSSATP
ncbi:MAG: caspase domain-containing protein [Granulosicoccus sp.]